MCGSCRWWLQLYRIVLFLSILFLVVFAALEAALPENSFELDPSTSKPKMLEASDATRIKQISFSLLSTKAISFGFTPSHVCFFDFGFPGGCVKWSVYTKAASLVSTALSPVMNIAGFSLDWLKKDWAAEGKPIQTMVIVALVVALVGSIFRYMHADRKLFQYIQLRIAVPAVLHILAGVLAFIAGNNWMTKFHTPWQNILQSLVDGCNNSLVKKQTGGCTFATHEGYSALMGTGGMLLVAGIAPLVAFFFKYDWDGSLEEESNSLSQVVPINVVPKAKATPAEILI